MPTPAGGVVLRIGVTGHRDPDPAGIPALRRQVAAWFAQLQSQLPGIELELVSGMADGADRIAVEAALEAGITVHALLPMPLALYQADFDPASQAVLRQLLADPRVRCTELPLPSEVDPAAVVAAGPARDRLYGVLAERLQRCTGVLLALWDGEDNGLPGGTGDTVLRYLGLVIGEAVRPPGRMALEGTGSGAVRTERPVYRIPTVRLGGQPAAGAPGYLGITDDDTVVPLGESLPPTVAREFAELVGYARESAERIDPDQHRYGLMSEPVVALRPAAVDALRRLDREYRRADLLAIHHQRWSVWLFRVFSIMAALMGLLFLIYSELASLQPLLASYLLLLVGGGVLLRFGNKRHWFTGHLMCRAIAETLRTRFFLTVGGVAADGLEQHLMRQFSIGRIAGFSWIGYVIRSATPFTAGDAPDPSQCLEFVRRAWIEDQHGYFARHSRQLQHAEHRLGRLKRLGLAGMVVAVVIILALKPTLMANSLWGRPLKIYIVFLLGMVPLWFGVWELYQIKMATKELGWQYRNQLQHLRASLGALSRADGPERASDVLADTAEHMLTDTYLWTVQRFHRDHDPPAAG